MTEETIRNFAEQLKYTPEIENAAVLKRSGKFVVAGMGGSNLAAGIIKSWKPKLDVIIHRDYGLPDVEERELKEKLIILSSYSGTTEETVGAFNEALSRELPLIVITTGGKLLESAQKNDAPYIQLPDIKAHPRFAIGLSIKATLKAMGEDSILNDITGEAGSLNADDYKEAGRNLARSLENKIPLIYSSIRNHSLAYFWKINFNETVKTPAFFSVFPELNHNEMIGFGSKLGDSGFANKFAFVFLTDPDDEPCIQKRMAATAKIFEDKGFTISKADITGPSLWHKSFASILAAFWTSYYLAEYYKVDSEDVAMIEEFKKCLS
jgi:glucose/mannose-6-phosphate isomerase